MSEDFNRVADGAVWPLIAENLAIMDEALGVSAKGDVAVGKLPAVHLLGRLSKTPARYFGPLLEIATGEGKADRGEARALLAEAKGVDDRLTALLSDSRQAIRAGSAEWLAARACTEAVKPLKARLKKEKSELARAAILTALQGLGEDLTTLSAALP